MKILTILVAVTILAGCGGENKTVSDQNDYAAYLDVSESDLTSLLKQEQLWKKKIRIEPRGFTFYEKLGSTYNQLFEKTGEVDYLHQSDSVFAIAERLTRGKWKVSSLLSLSSIAIKKHDFKTAANYAVVAREITDEKFGPLLMQFDAEMELGNYQMAKALLDKSKRPDSFDYLVRLAKFKDHEGDLDSAIYYMEQASKLIRPLQKEQKLWATANLADMYGHAGRIKDSYVNYLKVLALDSTYDYALRGIAWIAYSNDGKVREAKSILTKLQRKTALPDGYLLLAEICEFEGKQSEANYYTAMFVYEASRTEYQGMYNKYLIDIYNARGEFEKARRLAEDEVSKRPTPETYDWLAWTLFNQGKTDDAVRLYLENIEGETYEPDVIYHMGVVFHNAGKSRGSDYLQESLEASYELGPMIEKEIRSILKG